MGRFRNPRYAPEFLERKLSPSSATAGLAPPCVLAPTPVTTTTTCPPPAGSAMPSGPAPSNPTAVAPPPGTIGSDAPPDEGHPPIVYPGLPPTGPAGPAAVIATFGMTAPNLVS